jgi:hypothetical protein
VASTEGNTQPSQTDDTPLAADTPVSDLPPAAEEETPAPKVKGFPAAKDEYTDDRKPWEWKSRYPSEARSAINCEAWVLIGMLVLALAGAGVCLGLSNQSIALQLSNSPAAGTPSTARLSWQADFRILAIFFAGWVGGTTFAIKWLVHAVATGRWHLDRRYWRLMVPCLGGIYACVVLTLFDAGLFGAQRAPEPRSIAVATALAFLCGYFSDGVSGLLSNIANAVFGTLEKK